MTFCENIYLYTCMHMCNRTNVLVCRQNEYVRMLHEVFRTFTYASMQHDVFLTFR